MLWHCYHRQVAKEHPQSKYLSKLTSSLYSLQSGRRKGNQPLRDVKMKEKKGCWCLLKKMVSVSWADQGVESEALTDAQAYVWQEAFFQVRSALMISTNEWLRSARPCVGATPCFHGLVLRVCPPSPPPIPYKSAFCLLFSQFHFIKYHHIYHTKGIETN